MANQIVVSAGAKVRNLSGVLTGTSGVVSSVPLGAANGVATLDSGGKVPVSQLPSSVVTYLGTWNAATNTPTLVNGTGDAGDMYICNVAGTVNFGAGPVTFAVGDWVLYGSGTWQKSNGQNGTVTSVALTESGDSLNITGSPITTSGTINIGFNGTNLQYVNGAGNLTTFPTLITSIGLTMPSAFSVANSPLTANGTIAVTGAGVASQYIRGDGTLADFPSSGGGGSSVSYYLNGGTSQGTIGGTTYYEMSKTAVIGTGVDFTKTGDGFIVAFLTDANDPAQLNIPAGNWNYEIYASMSSNGGTPQMYAELYVYDGTTFTLISTSPHEILYDGTALNLYTFAMAVPATSLTLTDRLAVKLYATNSGGKTTTIHTQDGHLCQIITTFSTGITALNGLTAQVQYFQTGTSGTDFNISSTTATHTFNLPTASAANRGALSSADWTIFNGKQPQLNGTGFVKASGTTITYDNSTYYLASNPSAFIALTALSAGTGISYNNTTGVITNSAPDQVVALTASTGISVTGTYPNFTITNTSPSSGGTVTSVAMTVPTGLSVSGSPITTSGTLAVSLASGYSIPTTASQTNWDTAYTNRITSATAPLSIISNVIAMSEASGSVDGFLSRFDWATFNNKQATITLTTTGTSGAATFTSNTLNIPNYGSALSGYLPLTAGASYPLTGTLVGVASNWSGVMNITTSGYFPSKLITLAGAEPTRYSSNIGTIIIGGSTMGLSFGTRSNNVDYNDSLIVTNSNVLIGTTTDSGYKLDVNGTGRFNGVLTFAGNTRYGVSKVYDASTGDMFGMEQAGAAETGLSAAATRIFVAPVNSNNYISLGKYTNATTFVDLLKIQVTGAATFSSSVTAGGKIFTSASVADNIIEVINSDTTNGYGLYVRGGGTASGRYVARFKNGADSDVMWVGNSGNVGIGVVPTQSAALTFADSLGQKILLNNNANNYRIDLASSVSGGDAMMKFIAGSTAGAGEFGFYTTTNLRMLITSGGNVLIGTTTDATGKLQVNGTIYATGFYESSDIRFKNILETNPNVNVLGIDVIKFTRKDNDTNQVRYGYSAQQVQSILSDVVTGDEFLNVNYLDVHTLKIAALEQEIKELKAKMN